MSLPRSLAEAVAADAASPLQPFRARFALPEGVIYLDGNSLGALPEQTVARTADVVTREWGERLIRSWNEADWIGAPQRIGAKIADIVGAAPGSVIVADSTSVNLFKLIVAGMRAQPGRTEILTEPGNFPTDLHIAEGVASLLPGVTVRTVEAGEIAGAIGPQTAIVLLTHVHYKHGARHDMAALSAAARAAGALSLWDLSHSVGAVPVALDADGADMAVGCGYKYLNGGPGAPAFLYVREALQRRLDSPITGWMGHADPFAFGDGYAPAAGVSRFLAGTPSVIAMLALESGVDLFLDAPREALFARGAALFNLFVARMAMLLPELVCVTPRAAGARGSHVSFRHADAFPIMQALIERGVIGDYRAPDILRFGLTPLYVGLADVWRAVDVLAEVVGSGVWREPRFSVRGVVT
ncbi:kynureninase [Sphingomonas prati]|uniref:Kynureninase n=1 Tax=Sphingomonas prati TaxID=1843237 RepID=A0A7W9BP95_9SPHN|nr:kynureninase [Sphingomonas prati]MBB5727575.1 kynureninase [Sphingomonas prati]GGE79091.1 kynureninase [Sphingomonas prati]